MRFKTKKIRRFTSNLCLTLASWLTFLGRLALPKEKQMVVIALPVPGFFIVHDHMIEQRNIKHRGLRDAFSWETHQLPASYIMALEALVKKGRAKKK